MINGLKIKNIKQSDLQLDGRIFLSFDIDSYPYFLSLFKNNQGVFEPRGVYHDSEDRCPLCQSENRQYLGCDPFFPEKHALFLRLIEHPSIRLKWLYIPHIGETK